MDEERHDDLDELDEEPSFEIVVDEPPPERKPFNLKPFLIGLLVLVLGGGLGTAVYLFTAFDARDLIGLLDVADTAPRLTMALPGAGEGQKAEEPPKGVGGGLLTPPGVPGAAGNGEAAAPAGGETPPPAAPTAPSAAAEMPQAAAPESAPPAEAPPEPKSPAKPAAKAPSVDASGVPLQPSPRSADKPPTFEALPARTGETKPLPAAPVKEMLRKTQVGELPYPNAEGRQPWQAYARPWSGPADKGKVAVVVVDLGLDKTATEAAIAKLPAEVTLAFSPYAPSLDKWIKKARDFGHEVLLGLPAEGAGFPARDPGPYALMSSLSPEANLGRLETVMSKAAGYAGLVSLGDVYGASPQIAATLAAIKDHGLLYLGDGAAASSDRSPPLAQITAIVDRDLFREAIDMRLNQVSIAARTKGRAIAVVGGRPLSFGRLLAWINDLDGQGVVLAPVSTLVQSPAAPAAGKS